MKKSISSKLNAYSAVVGVLAVSSELKSNIIYSDISPDVLLTTDLDSYLLDLNNDGQIDFSIVKESSVSTSSFIISSSINVNGYWFGQNRMYLSGYNTTLTYTNYFIAPLDSKFSIRSSLFWLSSDSDSMSLGYQARLLVNSNSYPISSGGNWEGKQDKYIGLKLVVASDTFYGWA
ncbi:MAG: hypothetical protein IH948_07320, partial [Bacteroidetes bacterium]|nr:hypothetical protein [Bacteroidota bacterium]